MMERINSEAGAVKLFQNESERGRLCPHLGERIRANGKLGEVWWEEIKGEDLKTSNGTVLAMACDKCADAARKAGRSLSKQIEHERCTGG